MPFMPRARTPVAPDARVKYLGARRLYCTSLLLLERDFFVRSCDMRQFACNASVMRVNLHLINLRGAVNY